MAVSMFTRFVNIRNIMNVNFGVTGCTLNAIQNSVGKKCPIIYQFH